MSETKDLFFELGTEELPPNSLKKLSQALQENIEKGLKQADLYFTDTRIFATPRRIAISIKGIQVEQPDKSIIKRGPAISAAFYENGNPTKAAIGFAKSCNTTVGELEKISNTKGEWLSYKINTKGQRTTKLLPEIISTSLFALPVAKNMRWGSSDIEFVRPVHWVVLLFGDKVVDTKILGIDTGNITYGHRFHAPEGISICDYLQYEKVLYEQGKVIADFEARKDKIIRITESKAEDVNGKVLIDKNLLDEVTALNEWPVAILGSFDTRFLKLPKEVLVTTMQVNQKYFPVFNQEDDLLSYFITISNIESKRPESIKSGNERVVRPRLADAEFFWSQDIKIPLISKFKSLENIVFQNKLGNMADKTRRVQTLVLEIAKIIEIDAELVSRAALLSKTDLLTEMVSEFPSLQGVMGKYYALENGEVNEVAIAIEEQYLPKYSGGELPQSINGQVLSIADKLDTLTGIFSAGLVPTGDKDPYALRRAAIGILRIIIEQKLDLNIKVLLDFSINLFKHEFNRDSTLAILEGFIFERLKGICLDQGYSGDEFESVLSIDISNPLDFMARLHAVKAFKTLPQAHSLASANKRINNILKKSNIDVSCDFNVLELKEEQELLESLINKASVIEPLLSSRDYNIALNQLAELGPLVDNFFKHVMVMVENDQLKASRLGLLDLISRQFLQIADISKLQY